MVKTIGIFLPAIKSIAIFSLLTLCSSCNVHEPWPDTPVEPFPPVNPNIPISLNLYFDTDLPLYKEQVYTRANLQEQDMRYIVQAFTSSRASGSEPYVTWTFSSSISETPDFKTDISLPDGEYEFYVWADYVDPATLTDKYYDTSAWQTLTVAQLDNYQGSNDFQDAFRGYTYKTIINSSEVTESNTIHIEMKRPLARYEFITTDLDKFTQNQLDSSAQNISNGNGVSPDDYTIVFYYRDFTPMGYNVYTDKPNDAITGLKYESKITETENGVSLGFDYIFVNGTETTVKVVLGIYNKDGKLVSSTAEIEVPLVRSKNTIVRGEFLSGTAQGGVGVNPDFNGSYDIEI